MTAFLLCVTALISYSFGSLSTPILSSHIFFHENILKYSRDNVGITRFLKHHGWKGVAKLLVIEVFKVIIPVSIGGLLMLIVGHADVGFAFADKTAYFRKRCARCRVDSVDKTGAPDAVLVHLESLASRSAKDHGSELTASERNRLNPFACRRVVKHCKFFHFSVPFRILFLYF